MEFGFYTEFDWEPFKYFQQRHNMICLILTGSLATLESNVYGVQGRSNISAKQRRDLETDLHVGNWSLNRHDISDK